MSDGMGDREELAKRRRVLLTRHVSSSAHMLFFPFVVPTSSMTTLDVGQILSKSFFGFSIFLEYYVIPRYAAQQ